MNSSELKKSIIAHCLVWQTKLGDLLLKITESDIDVIYNYVEKSSELAMRVGTYYIVKFTVPSQLRT